MPASPLPATTSGLPSSDRLCPTLGPYATGSSDAPVGKNENTLRNPTVDWRSRLAEQCPTPPLPPFEKTRKTSPALLELGSSTATGNWGPRPKDTEQTEALCVGHCLGSPSILTEEVGVTGFSRSRFGKSVPDRNPCNGVAWPAEFSFISKTFPSPKNGPSSPIRFLHPHFRLSLLYVVRRNDRAR